jgi:hypothetical protein
LNQILLILLVSLASFHVNFVHLLHKTGIEWILKAVDNALEGWHFWQYLGRHRLLFWFDCGQLW